MKATPRPWYVAEPTNPSRRTTWVKSKESNTAYADGHVASVSIEDAELIVRAVNAHEDLVEFCEGFNGEVFHIIDDIKANRLDEAKLRIWGLQDGVREALRKANEGQ